MSGSAQWRPIRVFDLGEALRSKALGELRVGAPIAQVESVLGPPEHPRGRIGRSRVWELQYGNVSVLVSPEAVVGISIDFYGNRIETVRSGSFECWRTCEWGEFAVKEGLRLVGEYGVIVLKGDGLSIGLSSDGQLELVSLC